MKHLLLVVLALSACIDFDAKLDAGGDGGVSRADGGAQDAGGDAGGTDAGGRDAGGTDAAVSDAGCPGFTFEGWCWVNPTPTGEDLRAVLYRSDDEIWVGGAAGTTMRGVVTSDGGHRWAQYTMAGFLRPDDRSPEVHDFVALPDGGLLALGQGTPAMLRFDGNGWVEVPTDPGCGIAHAAMRDDGVFLAVGNRFDHEYYFTSSGEAPLDAISGIPGYGVAALAWPDGQFVRARIPATGVPELVGGAFDASLGNATIDPYGDLALWAGPDGRAWWGDITCKVGSVAPPATFGDAGSPCDGTPAIRAGTWAASLGKHVIVGSNGTVIEATSNELASFADRPSSFDMRVPSTAPTLHAVVVLPDAGGLVVGTGAFIATRAKNGSWLAENAVLRTNLHGFVPLRDGGVVAVGGDRVVAAPSETGAVIVSGAKTVFEANSEVLYAGWTDGTTFVAVGGDSQTGYLYVNHARSPTRTFDGTSLRAVAGTRGALTVVGDQGFFATQQSDGGWLSGRLTAGDPTELTSIVTTAAGTFVGAQVDIWDGGPRGRVYELRDQSLTLLASFDDGVRALAASGGVLLAAGEHTLVARVPLDGGLPESQRVRCSECRWTDFQDLAVNAAGELWAVGYSGVVYHFDGSAWSPVEVGTRRDLYAVSFSADDLGHEWLWLAGDYGTLIRKQLK